MIRRQRGITLIETIGAIAIASTMLIGLSTLIDNSLEDMKGQQAALYQSQLTDAARTYLSANYAQLVTNTADPATTLAVTVDTLKTAGLLPAGFSTTNAYGQSACLLIRRNAAAATPALDAIVATMGGEKIGDKDIAVVALNAGAGSGYISAAVPTLAQGASWQLDTTPYRGTACGGTNVLAGNANDAGHLVSALFNDGPGQLSTDFVYRDAVPGHPELNQMSTPLLMTNSALATAGDSCGSDAGLAIDSATRAVLSCGTDGLWKNALSSQWKDPVAAYSDLPVSGSVAGDVRIATSLRRAFTFDGSNWVALAVDQDGNLNVPGSLVANADSYFRANVTVTNQMQANNVYGVASVRGGYLRSDSFTESGEVNLYHRKNPGDPCHIPVVDNGVAVHVWPIGTILLDGNGLPLICANDAVFRYANGTFSP